MKNKFKLLSFIAAFFMTLIAAGCGNLRTELDINADGSGQRIMDVSISKSNFKDYVNGSFEDVTAGVQANCPSALTMSVEETDDSYKYSFLLTFTSIEDYESKVQSILSDSSKTFETNCQISDSVFRKGITFNENLSEETIMAWFSDYLVNAGYVTSNNKSNIFNDSSSYFGFEGNIEEVYGFDISRVETIRVDHIDFFTTINDRDNYSRTIDFYIQEAEYNKNPDEIENYMNNAVADFAQSSWSENLGMKCFTIEYDNLSAAQMQSAMNQFCYTEDGYFAVTDYFVTKYEEEPYSIGNSPFSFDKSYIESYDTSVYNSDANAYFDVNYFIYADKNDIGAYNIVFDDDDYKLQNDSDLYGGNCSINYFNMSSESDENDNFYEVYSYVPYKNTFAIQSLDYLHFSSIDVDIDVNKNLTLEKKYTFHCDNANDTAITKAFDKINEILEASESDNVQDIVVKKDGADLILLFNGDTDTVYEQENTFFAARRPQTAKENKWISASNKMFYSDSVTFENLVYDDAEDYWKIPVEVTISMPGSDLQVVTGDEDFTAEKHKCTASLTSNRTKNFMLTSNLSNLLSFVWILVILIAILLFVLGLVLIVLFIISKIRKGSKKDKNKEVKKTVNEVKETATEVKEDAVTEVKEETVTDETTETSVVEESKAEETVK